MCTYVIRKEREAWRGAECHGGVCRSVQEHAGSLRGRSYRGSRELLMSLALCAVFDLLLRAVVPGRLLGATILPRRWLSMALLILGLLFLGVMVLSKTMMTSLAANCTPGESIILQDSTGILVIGNFVDSDVLVRAGVART